MAQCSTAHRPKKFPPARLHVTALVSSLAFDSAVASCFFCAALHSIFFLRFIFRCIAVFDDGSKKLTVRELFMMSAAARCIVQSLLLLPASNDDDTLLLLPSLFVGSAAQLRSLLQVIFVTFSSSNNAHFSITMPSSVLIMLAGLQSNFEVLRKQSCR
jgi:hypothetical protein